MRYGAGAPPFLRLRIFYNESGVQPAATTNAVQGCCVKKLLLKRMLFIPLGIIAAAATWYAQGHPDWTEQAFSSTAYPVLSTAVGFLPSLVDFSVAEWLSGAFLLFCLAYAAYYVRKAVIDKDERGMMIYRGTMGAIAIACTVYFAFTFLCGLNYYRCTFSSYTGYDVEQVGADPAQRQEELAQLCSSLADDLGQERVLLGEDADLFAAQPGEFEAWRRSIPSCSAPCTRRPSRWPCRG